MINRQVILRARPSGIPQADHFAIIETSVPGPSDGEVLVRNLFLSVEPAMRGWIADADNYAEPVPIRSVMRSLCVGVVEASRDPRFRAGDKLLGWFGWQLWAVVSADAVIFRIPWDDLSPSLALGVLGLNGVTALVALEGIGRPVAGETIVVSTAAGAVGSAVGQIARLKGCRTVGITGSAEKQALCTGVFGYDNALNYRDPGLGDAIASACPQGVDVYFDNTAGPVSDSVFDHLAIGARIVVCGTASVSSWTPPPTGPRVERRILTRRARMEGFVIFDHMKRFAEASARLHDWVADGRLRYREDVSIGLDSCLPAIDELYRGANLGKRIVRLD